VNLGYFGLDGFPLIGGFFSMEIEFMKLLIIVCVLQFYKLRRKFVFEIDLFSFTTFNLLVEILVEDLFWKIILKFSS
jgi:hypothetical protein